MKYITTAWELIPQSGREHIVSFIQTFIAVFVATLGASLSVLPPEVVADPAMYSKEAIGAALVAILRTAIKLTWTLVFTKK